MSAAAAGPGKTVLKRDEQFRDRWSNSGDRAIRAVTSRLGAADLRQLDLFRDYDDKFLEKISPDVSVATWNANSILFEEGSYIDVAFWVLEGEIEVALEQVRGPGDVSQTVLQTQLRKQDPGRGVTLLTAMDFDLPRGVVVRLGPGEFFGEIGALNGWPQSVTARTKRETTLVQIRVPALREMRRKSPALKQRLDTLYRERSLLAQLQRTPLLAGCQESFLRALAQRVELVSHAPGETIVQQGEPVDGLYLVRSGFVKLSQRVVAGNVAVSYLSKGMTLGEAELMLAADSAWLWTATSVANTELAKIAGADFTVLMRTYPEVERRLWEVAAARVKEAGFARKNVDRGGFIDTALGQGLVEGTSMLVIDLDVCTRCDDCVRACAATHDGLPRFVREGNKVQNMLITRACFHCQDPLCLIGCPTGAIHRAEIGDIVEITENICIGCKTCATQCPYDAIVMHDTGQTWPADMVPENLRGKKQLLATKCDQCTHTGYDPACVRNCPQGCAVRVGSPEEFDQFVARRRERT